MLAAWARRTSRVQSLHMRAPHCPCGVLAHCVRFSARWSLPARGTEARPQEKVRMNQQELPRKDQRHSLNCMPEVLHHGRKRNHAKIKCSHALVNIRVTCQCKSLWHCGLSDECRFVWQRCSSVLAFVKAFDKKILDICTQSLSPDSGLRTVNTNELLNADRKLWNEISSLHSEGWTLDEALHEMTSIRADIHALLQPRARPPTQKGNGKGGKGGKGPGKKVARSRHALRTTSKSLH